MERMEARTTTQTDNEDELNEKQRDNRLQFGEDLSEDQGQQIPKESHLPLEAVIERFAHFENCSSCKTSRSDRDFE